MNDISKEFVKVMHENYYYLTKENLQKYFEWFAQFNSDTGCPDDPSYYVNLKQLKEDRKAIMKELKDYFED